LEALQSEFIYKSYDHTKFQTHLFFRGTWFRLFFRGIAFGHMVGPWGETGLNCLGEITMFPQGANVFEIFV